MRNSWLGLDVGGSFPFCGGPASASRAVKNSNEQYAPRKFIYQDGKIFRAPDGSQKTQEEKIPNFKYPWLKVKIDEAFPVHTNDKSPRASVVWANKKYYPRKFIVWEDTIWRVQNQPWCPPGPPADPKERKYPWTTIAVNDSFSMLRVKDPKRAAFGASRRYAPRKFIFKDNLIWRIE